MSRGRCGALGWIIAGALGCAGGSNDPGSTSAFDPTNPAGGSTSSSQTSAGPSGPMTSADGTGDTTGEQGRSCCEASPMAGCGDSEIQTCVCTFNETCCSQVWSETCVGLAGECGDPDCPAPETTGMPGDSSGGTPMVTCDELAMTEGWMYYRCQQGDSQCNGVGTPTTDCEFCCEYCGEPGDQSCGDHATAQGWPAGSAQCEWNGNGACGGQGYAGTCDCDYCCQL